MIQLISKIFLGLILLAPVQAGQICGLCGSLTNMPKRWDFPVNMDVTPWKTCKDVFFELGSISKDSPNCQPGRDKYQAVCCNDQIPPGWETPPTPAPVSNTGNEPVCRICGNDDYPGKPNVFISARYVGSFTCGTLYHRGNNGLIPGFMCGPLQDYAHGKCGCDLPAPTLPPVPAPTKAPKEGCTLIGGWRDKSKTTCGWYEDNEPEGCPEWGWYPDENGVTANEACCHCAKGNNKDICNDVSGWKDDSGTSCDWYENNEPEGCPNWSWYPGKAGLNAGQACCHCSKGASCSNTPGWKDDVGTSCDWYEQNEPAGCPKWGWYPSVDGVTAEQACCHCKSR